MNSERSDSISSVSVLLTPPYRYPKFWREAYLVFQTEAVLRKEIFLMPDVLRFNYLMLNFLNISTYVKKCTQLGASSILINVTQLNISALETRLRF